MGKTLRVFGVSLAAMLFTAALVAPVRAAESAAKSITELKITAATLDPRTGIAMVSATVTCSETMQLNAYSVIYQGRGQSNHFAGVAGGTPVTCGSAPTTFTVEDTPLYDTGKLIPAEAHVNVFVEDRANPLGSFRGEDRDMRLIVEHR